MTLFSRLVPALLVLPLVFLPRAASAAPQALGIVATADPLPMMCDATGCRVELSTFCLQEAREAPARGTRYRPSHGEEILATLVAVDGSRRRIPVGDWVTVESARGFSAVNLALPAGLWLRSRVVAATLEIGRHVALEPMPVAGDPMSQAPDELARATGATRLLASRIFDDHTAEGDAARLIERMINALPEGRPLARETDGRVWRLGAGGDPARAAGAEGIALARLLHDSCVSLVAIGQHADMRHCLQDEVDALMARGSIALWAAAAAS